MSLVLYSDIAPRESGHYDTKDDHELYYELCGAEGAIPAVFIHGGPGAPPRWAHRQLFDMDLYQVLFYHQRGVGQSTPYGSLENNTIDKQVEDLCALKNHLGIAEPWVVLGNSWGSALAQIYAVRHPDHIRHLVLGAVSFADQIDANSFLEEGFASRIFPVRFSNYQSHIPEDERGDGLAAAYYKRIYSEDRAVSLAAVKEWAMWNYSIHVMNMDRRAQEKAARDPAAFENMARLFFHYYMHEYSSAGRAHIWPYLDVLKKMPATIIHGQYDLICPAQNAFELHQALPHSEIHYVQGNGHFSLEPNFSRDLQAILDGIALGD
jgi:proline iminopeptidase